MGDHLIEIAVLQFRILLEQHDICKNREYIDNNCLGHEQLLLGGTGRPGQHDSADKVSDKRINV